MRGRDNFMIRLFVNVDHVATLREARKTTEPDPLIAALLAEKAGADGITVHLREDRRHIQDHDVNRIKQNIQTKLNLEMAATEEMVEIAIKTKPYQVSLVPEKRQEITTEGGLDVRLNEKIIKSVKQKLDSHGILVSLFVDPNVDQIQAAHGLGVPSIEINTGLYTELSEQNEIDKELAKIVKASSQAKDFGMRVFAGHGLNNENVISIAAIPQIEELNIGHNLVARSIYSGMDQAIKNMKDAIQKGVEQRKE